MHRSLSLLLTMTTSFLAATTLALPDIYLGTLDICTPGRYPSVYAAWLVKSDACADGDDSDGAITSPIGMYPLSNAGCGLGSFTVGGFDDITFEGCTGPGGPYPTSVWRKGKKRLECAPVRRVVEDRLCGPGEDPLCEGRERALKTVLRCRKGKDCD